MYRVYPGFPSTSPLYEEYFIFGYYGTPLQSKIVSSFWGIVFYIRNIILLGSTTKKRCSYVPPSPPTLISSDLREYSLNNLNQGELWGTGESVGGMVRESMVLVSV